MSGVVFFVCSTSSWISLCHLAAISVQLKRSTMSKRAPGRRTEGEPVGGEIKASKFGIKKVSLDSGASYSRVNQGLGRNSVLTSAERSVRDRFGSSTASSQEWKRDDLAFASAGRPVRGIHNRLARTKLAYHHLQIFDNLYHEKVCTNVRHKLNRSEDDKILDQKMQCIDSGCYLCQQRWKQQCILGKITMRIWLRTGTPTSCAQDVVRHDDTSPLVQFFVWERCRILQKPMRSGKISFNISNSPTTTKNYLESMEKLVSSSGIFSQDTTLQIPKRSKTKMAACQASPEETKDRIVFISMFNDIDLTKKGQSNECCSKSERDYAKKKRLQLGHWSCLGPGEEEKWCGTHNHKPEGKWNITADGHGRQFQRQTSSIASFLCVGSENSWKGKVEDVRFTSARILRMQSSYFAQLHSANQPSIYGAVANWCDEFTQLIPGQSH